MRNILDQVGVQRKPFRPKSTLEYFALRLAQKLDDAPLVEHYIVLADRHGQQAMLDAYQSAHRAAHEAMPLAECFHAALGYRKEGGVWKQ